MDKQDILKKSVRHLKIADRLVSVTYPLVKDNKLIMKIFDEIFISIINSLIILEDKQKINFENCKSLDKEKLKVLGEIYEIQKKHKACAMEFSRKDKIVILSDSLGTKIINLKDIKKYLLFAKEIFVLANRKINP